MPGPSRARFALFVATGLTLAACPDKSDPTPTQTTTDAPGDSTGASAITTSVITSSASSGPGDTTQPASTSTTSTSSSTTSDDNSSAPASDTDPVCVTKMLHEQPPGPCDPFAQDCPECQKCNPYADDGGGSWNSDKCVFVVPDPDQVGEPCTAPGGGNDGNDSCDHGAMCWDVDAENNGTCVALCTGSPDNGVCADPEKTCAVYSGATLPLCVDRCDPLMSDCSRNDLCVANPTGLGFLCLLDASGDGGQVHSPCNYSNGCDPGLHCAEVTAAEECDQDQQGCCEPFCDLTIPNPDSQCPGVGQQCTPLFDPDTNPAPPGDEDVGYCAVPPP